MRLFRINKLFKILFLSAVLLFVNSCKTATTEPVIKKIDENPPGRRDYVWTIDTIPTPRVSLYRIWGSSANDVWAIATGNSMDFILWHYDGFKWREEKLNTYGWITPFSIFGFSKDNLWIAGGSERKGTVWHWNGSIWKPEFSISMPGSSFTTFNEIWGESENDLYAVGHYDSLVNAQDNYHGIICHYDGISWQRLDIEVNTYQIACIYKEKEGNGKYYMLADYYSPSERIDEYRILEFDGNKIKEINSPLIANNSLNVSMRMAGGKIYYKRRSNLCRYINDTMQVIKTISGFEKGYIIGGRNENDLFFGTSEGLAHYNGTDLQTVFQNPQSSTIMDMAIFGDTVFVVAMESSVKGYFIKGVLK